MNVNHNGFKAYVNFIVFIYISMHIKHEINGMDGQY